MVEESPTVKELLDRLFEPPKIEPRSEEDMERGMNRCGRETGVHIYLLGDDSITTLPCQVGLDDHMTELIRVDGYDLGGRE